MFDLIRVLIADYCGVGVFEAEFGRKRGKHGRITNVQSLFPVGPHEPVVRHAVLALQARELGQAEGGMRVRHDLWRRVVDQSLAVECQLEVPVEALSVPSDEVRSRNALGWVLGMKVEGQPLDLGVEPTLEPLGGALADAAERSDVIGPDQDLVPYHRARLAGRTVPPPLPAGSARRGP